MQIERILEGNPHDNILICIDANAHSPMWFCREEDAKGIELNNFVTRRNLVIHNQPNQPPTHSSGSNIDLTISNNAIANKVHRWTVHQCASLSDHNLITFEIEVKQLKDFSLINKYNMKLADFPKINEGISALTRDLGLISAGNVQEADYVINRYAEAMEPTCEANIPKIKIRNKYVPWWTPRLTELRKETGKLLARNTKTVAYAG